jgi:hypothetical protein
LAKSRIGRAIHEGRDHQQSEEGHDATEVVDHLRRIAVHAANAAADLDVVHRHCGTAHQAKQQEEDVYHRLAQPIAHFEEEEPCDHA